MSERCLRVLLNSVSGNGTVIVNVDDPSLAALFTPGEERLVAVSYDATHPFLQEHRERVGLTVAMDHGDALIACGERHIARWSLCAVTEDAQAVSHMLAFAAAWSLRPVAASCQLANLPTRENPAHDTTFMLGPSAPGVLATIIREAI
jgi:hypothetical protein